MEFAGIINGLYYKVKGQGKAIIMVPGIGGTHSMFDPQVEELSKENMVITIDLKGNGQSESVKTTNYLPIHMDSILELMDHLRIERAIFAGLSYGGIVVQNFAIKYPEKVEKMVLIDTYAQTFPKDASEVKLTLLGAFVLLASWAPKKLLKKSLHYFSPYKKWQLAHEELMSILETSRAKDVTLQLLEVFNMNLLDELNRLDIPTLVIVGDQLQTIVRKSKEIADNLVNSKLLVVKDSFDPTNLCQPEIVNQALIDFFEKEKAFKG